MQSQNIQKGILALFAVFFAWLMPWVASAGITFIPTVPTNAQATQIVVTFDTPSPCYRIEHNVSSVANRIRIDFTSVAYVAGPGMGKAPEPPCAGQVSSNTRYIPVVLATGNYTVEVYNRLDNSATSQLLFTTSFDVIPFNVVPQLGQTVHLRVKPLPLNNYDVWVEAGPRITPYDCFSTSGSTSVTGNSIRVDLTVVSGYVNGVCSGRSEFTSASLGQLPPGKYSVAVYYNGVPGQGGDFTVMPDVIPDVMQFSPSPNDPGNTYEEFDLWILFALPNSCFEVAGYPTSVTGHEIRLDLSLVGTHAGCVAEPTLHAPNIYYGKLAAGTYDVRVYFNGTLRLTSSVTINPAADLALSQMVAPNPVIRKGFVLHSIDVVNNGPDAADRVTVQSVLPDNFSYTAASASQGVCKVTEKGNITCKLGPLSPGATAKLEILAKARSAGSATLRATVRSRTPDFETGNDSVDTSVLVSK